MKPSIALLVSAMVVTAAPVQIPEQPKWEISFSQVEAAAGLSNLRGAEQDSLEARVMQRAWSFAGPLPFLRLTRIDRAARATGFLYWRSPGDVVASRQPTGPDVVCRAGICVRPIGLEDRGTRPR